MILLKHLNTDKLKIGDHIIVDFGSACLKVIGFESEPDFLATKCPESDVNNMIYKHNKLL